MVKTIFVFFKTAMEYESKMKIIVSCSLGHEWRIYSHFLSHVSHIKKKEMDF